MSNSKARTISPGASFLLDSLRLSAALTVLVIHAKDQWFPELRHLSFESGNTVHAAVVVFFVLSGFVIAHTTTGNNRGPIQYGQARLSRLCSVLIPALFITALAEYLIGQWDPVLNETYTRGDSWPRYIISALFLNEIWFFHAAPLINGPLWSLSFEFWYYVIFGLIFYSSRSIMFFILGLIACIVAGPKIMVMMPVWLAGYAAYRLPRLNLSAPLHWCLVFGTLLIAGILITFLPVFPFPVGVLPWSYAGGFVTDWIIGLVIGTALWFLPSEISRSVSPSWIGAFRKIADLTFPIYVLHYPLLILCRAFFNYRENDRFQFGIALCLVLIFSSVIGLFLEKQRPVWIRFFNWALTKLSNFLVGKKHHLQNSREISL